jgi:hypothetical protein
MELHRRAHRLRACTLVLVLGLLTAACGGSGGSAGTVTVTQSPPPAAPASPPASPPAPAAATPSEPQTHPVTLTCGWWMTHIADLPQTTTNAYAISTCSGETYGSGKPVVLDVYE